MDRRIALILGDQLSLANPALARIDRDRDMVLLIEAAGEATHVWSHKARIALFLSAMRHFAGTLEAAGLSRPPCAPGCPVAGRFR